MGKHITDSESEAISRIYTHYQGKWQKIMADPEIKAMGHDRYRIHCHLNYKKRAKPVTRKFRSRTHESENDESSSFGDENCASPLLYDGSSSSSSSSANSVTEVFSGEEEDEEEEFILIDITGRKKGTGKAQTRWYAHYNDGDRRWVTEDCFVDLDGTTSAVFKAFQKKHPGTEDIRPLPLKRPLETESSDTSVVPLEKKAKNNIMLKVLPSITPSIDKSQFDEISLQLATIVKKQEEMHTLLQQLLHS